MKVRPFFIAILIICLFSVSPIPVYAGDDHGNNGNNGNNNNNDNHNGNNGNNGNDNDHDANGNGNGWSWNNTNVAWHHQNGDHQYCNHGTQQHAPFDGGFTLLVGAGLAYGVKRARDQRKKLLPQINT